MPLRQHLSFKYRPYKSIYDGSESTLAINAISLFQAPLYMHRSIHSNQAHVLVYLIVESVYAQLGKFERIKQDYSTFQIPFLLFLSPFFKELHQHMAIYERHRLQLL